MDLQLKNKVVLITGGSSGIGLAAAKIYAAEGANVAIVARDKEKLERSGKEITQHIAQSDSTTLGKVVAISGDLSDPNVPERVVGEVASTLGDIDILVNNVGLAYLASFSEVTDEQWQSLWELNVMSYVRMSRATVPQMKKNRSGVIINVSSTAGKRPSTGMANYSVTKSAVQSLSRLLADTYAKDGIRSIAICPGPTASEAWIEKGGLADQSAQQKGISHEKALEQTGAGRPLGRLATPDEIASTIVFASSPLNSYTTGAAWSVDGGSVPVII